MILQNKNEENKIFIDEDLEKYINVYDFNEIKRIEFECERIIKLVLLEEKISFINIEEIRFDTIENELCFYSESVNLCEKIIDEDEIISLSLGEKKDQFQVIELTTMKMPKFFYESNYNDNYPKFEINLSDCVYNMKIYLSENECIEIPNFQSHVDIHSTLDYISRLVYYITEWRPEFIKLLCDNDNMSLIIKDNQGNKTNYGIINYKLGQDGLYITAGELENYLVEWQKFFKLVMDHTWEVGFKDE